jgi:hypothetical protein
MQHNSMQQPELLASQLSPQIAFAAFNAFQRWLLDVRSGNAEGSKRAVSEMLYLVRKTSCSWFPGWIVNLRSDVSAE